MSTRIRSSYQHPPRKGWTLVLASLGLFMAALDTLVVTTALPVLRVDLHASLVEEAGLFCEHVNTKNISGAAGHAQYKAAERVAVDLAAHISNKCEQVKRFCLCRRQVVLPMVAIANT